MGVLGSLIGNATSAGSSSGGSINSGGNVSQNYSLSDNSSDSWSYSRTFGSEATAKSAQEAIRADERQRALMYETMMYNTAEAEKQRTFEQEMADTIYTRSVKNMIEAGINPILAAGAGLSAAHVGSGASASLSTPSTFMGQTFADQVSASGSHSEGHSESAGSSSGWSNGSSWNQSKWGIMEAIDQIGEAAEGAIDGVTSALNTGYNAYADFNLAHPIIGGIISGITGAAAPVTNMISENALEHAQKKLKTSK